MKALCSVTGKDCKCATGEGCAARVRYINEMGMAVNGLLGIRMIISDIEGDHLLRRRYPGPELRSVSAHLAAAITELQNIKEALERENNRESVA